MLAVEVMKIEIAILRNEKIKKLKKENPQNVNTARPIKGKHVGKPLCLKQSASYDKWFFDDAPSAKDKSNKPDDN